MAAGHRSEGTGVKGSLRSTSGQVVALRSEKVLDTARSDHGEEATDLAGTVRHRVRNLAREPYESASLQGAALLTHDKAQLPLEADDDLVLNLVHMQRWPAREDFATSNDSSRANAYPG